LKTELGGDHHVLADRCDGFADEFLIGERFPSFGGVEQAMVRSMAAPISAIPSCLSTAGT